MIRYFANTGTEDVWNGVDSKAAWKTCPAELWPRARRKLDDLNGVRHYADLTSPPSNRLHKLGGRRRGKWAISINDQYRICFRWQGLHAFDVEITDYH